MVEAEKLVKFTDALLHVDVRDGCPNGLQVEGNPSVQKLVTGVSASRMLLEEAIAAGADMILVHHGYFWRHDPLVVTGRHYQKLKLLLTHEVSLLAYHLPLDYHDEYGNNAQLARLMSWQVAGRMASNAGIAIGMHGYLSEPQTVSAFAAALSNTLKHEPLVITNDTQRMIKTLAWCTGAAGDDIHYAIKQGVDCFVTGEISERIVHVAREADIVVVAAGHHATERYGVMALGDYLAHRFGISHQYIEVSSPV